MRVLVTGASGFIGGFLVKHCIKADAEVLGIDIRGPADESLGSAFEHCDVKDFSRLSKLIAAFRPERIYHLAAQSYPTVSLSRPLETMDTNVGGTINLFECLRALAMMPVVIVACSSAEYGPIANEDLPADESHALCPLHPYGVSKVAQDLLAAQYFANYAIPAIRIRLFSTTGPGKLGDVCSDLTKRAIEIERQIRPSPLTVGNLSNRRSIVDVRDLVQGLWLAAEYCKAGEVYNLGGDDIYSVRELVEAIRTLLGFNFDVEQRPELMRPCDEPITAGSNARFRSCCNWKPEISISTTLRDMLEWWRDRPGGAITPQSRQEVAPIHNLG